MVDPTPKTTKRKCNRCGQFRPVHMFGSKSWCTLCQAAYNHTYHLGREAKHTYTGTCWQCKRQLPPEAFRMVKGEPITTCLDCSRKSTREHFARLRQDALLHYGGSPPKCSCRGCGEDRLEFLSIDHMDGGGAKHRRGIRKNFYQWLYHQGYPGGFRVLCHNCNLARGFYGYCPHENELYEEEPPGIEWDVEDKL